MSDNLANPWKNFDRNKSHCLPADEETITNYNKNCPYLIDLDLLPEPFNGNPLANVVLLLANPGVGGQEKNDHEKEEFQTFLLQNLTHENQDYPLFFLNPALAKTDGAIWIRSKLKELLNENKFKDVELANGILMLQLHPYHSKKFAVVSEASMLTSQAYTFQLLKNALNRKNTLFVVRGLEEWKKGYAKIFHGEDLEKAFNGRHIKRSSSISMAISSKNLLDNGFEKIVNALRLPLE